MNIFRLPPDLLENIVTRTLVAAPEPARPARSPSPPAVISLGSKVLACTVCINASFADVDDQRSHYRSDWHRYNVKAKVSNKPLLTEVQFQAAVSKDLSDSISGSESSDSEEESEDDAVHSALQRVRIQDSEDYSTPERTIPRSPIRWFHSPPTTQVGVYEAVLPSNLNIEDYVNELKHIQDAPEGGRLWTMLMIAGGHFAGMIVRVSQSKVDSSSSHSKSKGHHQKPEFEVILHKTFHRYTTRRKQGGSQSLNDNAKGFAKSAGAMLRRYGEQALRDDIRNLMAEWATEIDSSERIWIRANVSNKRIFYDYDNASFSKSDSRLRTFPFPTRRPTQTELLRCLNELIRAKVSHFTEDELRQQDEELLASLPKPKPIPVVQPKASPSKKNIDLPKLTPEQEREKQNWERMIEMTRKGRVDALSAFWDKISPSLDGIDSHIPQLDGLENPGWTLLHVASSEGQELVITWLIEEKGANPTSKITSSGTNTLDADKTPYEIAASKTVRDTFRRLAGAYPDRWDWLGAGRVPSILSKEMEQEQESKKKTRRKGLKEKMKEREEKQSSSAVDSEPETSNVVETVAPTVSAGPQRLGGGATPGGVAGLTPEMRLKIERERRARAIEARMREGA